MDKSIIIVSLANLIFIFNTFGLFINLIFNKKILKQECLPEASHQHIQHIEKSILFIHYNY